MNKNKLLFVLASLIFLSTPGYVHAEDEVNISNGSSSVRVRIEQKVNTVRDNIEEKREIRVENREENREERRTEFAKKHAERISKRFTEYYERLSKIIKKVETKVTDSESAKAKLNEAKTKLEQAKKLGEEAVTLFNSITTGNLGSNSDVVTKAKNKANEARLAFIETLKLVQDAFKIAKQNT